LALGLGFDLKKSFLGVVLLLVSFFVSFVHVAGCVKQPGDDIDYGPEYRRSEVAESLKMALGEASPLDIKLNEFSQSDLTRAIRGRALIDLLETVGLSIVSRAENERQVQINLVEERVTYDLTDSHNNKKLVREFLECTNKTTLRAENCEPIGSQPAPTFTPIPTGAPISSGEPLPTVNPSPTDVPSLNVDYIVEQSLKLFPQMSQEDYEEPRITYHQLKVTHRTTELKKQVKGLTDCSSYPYCLINVTDIEFDQVNWLAYNKGDKIHVKITTSKQVPFLSRILEKCQQGSVPIKQEGKPEKDWPRLLVTFCETVRNFEKGE
jgi:hypothetical protein